MREAAIGSRVRRVLLAASVLVLVAAAGEAQPADDYSGPAQLTGAITLPFNGSLTPGNLAFNLTGAGCTTPTGFQLDSVVCFVPTNNCTVDFTCTHTGGATGTGLGTVNVRDNGNGGACTQTAGPCVAGAATASSPTSVTNVSLTAGTNYCFVCNSDGQGPGDLQGYSITANTGDCGALPVELLNVDVQSGAR